MTMTVTTDDHDMIIMVFRVLAACSYDDFYSCTEMSGEVWVVLF